MWFNMIASATPAANLIGLIETLHASVPTNSALWADLSEEEGGPDPGPGASNGDAVQHDNLNLLSNF